MGSIWHLKNCPLRLLLCIPAPHHPASDHLIIIAGLRIPSPPSLSHFSIARITF